MGVGGAAITTTPVAAQMYTDNIDISYHFGPATAGTRSDLDIPTDDGEGVITSEDIEFEPNGELELNPDTIIRIRNTDTGAELDVVPETTQTVPVGNRVSLARGRSLYTVEGEIERDENAKIEVLVDEDAFEWTTVDVTTEGDADVLTDGGTYASYRVELINGNGTQFAATDERVIPVALERGFIQQEGTSGKINCSIALANPLPADFHVEFDVAGFADDGFHATETTIENSGTDTLEWTTDTSGSKPGEYSGWVCRVSSI